MSRADFRLTRLFVAPTLAAGVSLTLSREQANYLVNVMRLAVEDRVLVFNGRDGEWRARLAEAGRKGAALVVDEQTRPQESATDLDYLFAPLKMARLDYMVQKAIEMGARRLRPVITQHTQASRVNLERMTANVIEAAEQCGVLAIADVLEPVSLTRLIADWPANDAGRRLLFCDEAEATSNPLPALGALPRGPLGVLVGPEGGFSADERAFLRAQAFVTPIPLGPRILRADTAAVAALAIVQTSLGDWL
jgi:16S rRNA (uracil1498-N3)-methyltransferase